jgi:gas vesicle protein
MPTFTEDINERITTGLDRLEAALPTIPAKMLQLQRTAVKTYCERSTEFWTSVRESGTGFFDTAKVSGKTVVGQARAAAEDVATTAQTNAKTVVGQARAAVDDVNKATRSGANRVTGQARAQGRRLAAKAETSTERVLDTAIHAVEDKPGSGKPYEQWTKAELLERATELDITGRTTMSKPQLIAALRK